MSRRLAVLFAGVLALAAVGVGCGSSSDGTTDSVAAAVTKAQLIAQGDAICKQGDTEIEEGFESYADENGIPEGQEPSRAQGVELVETVIVPSIKSQAELIRGLGLPEGDEAEIEAMLDSLDAGVEEAEEKPEFLFEEDTDPFGDANAKAKAYGFEVCGRS